MSVDSCQELRIRLERGLLLQTDHILTVTCSTILSIRQHSRLFEPTATRGAQSTINVRSAMSQADLSIESEEAATSKGRGIRRMP